MTELTHCSYLLRLWREHREQPWRVTLITVAQPEAHQHFHSLDECFAFLQQQTATSAETSTRETQLLYVREQQIEISDQVIVG